MINHCRQLLLLLKIWRSCDLCLRAGRNLLGSNNTSSQLQDFYQGNRKSLCPSSTPHTGIRRYTHPKGEEMGGQVTSKRRAGWKAQVEAFVCWDQKMFIKVGPGPRTRPQSICGPSPDLAEPVSSEEGARHQGDQIPRVSHLERERSSIRT